ncbi:MAG TPA: twin-arginine translocase subunit TatC [Longimicrobium sp.]|nr:twin-arginine translocase subunit TatC [Longimicrobium sp.]
MIEQSRFSKWRKSRAEEMPFLDHLEELRWRLLWCLLAVGIGTGIGFLLVMKLNVLGILISPVEPFLNGGKLKYLSPTDPFFITVKLAFVVGFLLASPIVVYQVWAFFGPALLPSEKRVIVPSLYLGLVLFAAGVYGAYMIVLPMTLKFTMGFQTEALEQAITVGPYLEVVTRVLLAFGAVFELPVVVLILSALGLVTPEFLSSKRRHALVGIAIVSSLLTPGDVITLTLMMMVPLMFLYELSIVLSRVVAKKRRAATEAEAAEAARAAAV